MLAEVGQDVERPQDRSARRECETFHTTFLDLRITDATLSAEIPKLARARPHAGDLYPASRMKRSIFSTVSKRSRIASVRQPHEWWSPLQLIVPATRSRQPEPTASPGQRFEARGRQGRGGSLKLPRKQRLDFFKGTDNDGGPAFGGKPL